MGNPGSVPLFSTIITGSGHHRLRRGTLEEARQVVAHASTRTTRRYGRRDDHVTINEVVEIDFQGYVSNHEIAARPKS